MNIIRNTPVEKEVEDVRKRIISMKAHIAELPLYREGTSPSTNWREERIGVDTGINRFCGRKLRQFPFDGFCFLCEVGGSILYSKEDLVGKLTTPLL